MTDVHEAAERWRDATLELIAATLEHTVAQATDALRGGIAGPAQEAAAAFAFAPIAFEPAADLPHYTDERELPQPEKGDELSGLAREAAIRGGAIPPADGITEQEGMTEEEHEEAQR